MMQKIFQDPQYQNPQLAYTSLQPETQAESFNYKNRHTKRSNLRKDEIFSFVGPGKYW